MWNHGGRMGDAPHGTRPAACPLQQGDRWAFVVLIAFRQATIIPSGYLLRPSVEDCAAAFNGNAGIEGISNVTVVSHSNALENGYTGIFSYTVTDCTSTYNGGTGIQAGTARGCTAGGNALNPQIVAVGFTGENICDNTPCP
jgi:hypothetical protein